MKAFVAAGLLAVVAAECPNACSSHGECGTKDSCTCYDGYTGNDCSQRMCPFGLSFVDLPRGDLNHDGALGISSSSVSSAYSAVTWSRYKEHEYWPTIAGSPAHLAGGGIDPSSISGGGWQAKKDEAHFYAMCSQKGTCDYTSGTCRCYDGYTGTACQRTTCPNDCSGHGMCRTVADIAGGALNKRFLESSDGVNLYSGVETPFEYRLWDAEKNRACVCDVGYSGVDCSLRECPRGDDPLTACKQVCGNRDCTPEIQGFTIYGGTGNNEKNYRLEFTTFQGEQFVTDNIELSTAIESTSAMAANAAAIKAAIEALPDHIAGEVTVSAGGDEVASVNGDPTITHVRHRITFSTLPGNVPEMRVLAGTTNPGTDPVVQPSQVVQIIEIPLQGFFVGGAYDGSIAAEIFPLETRGFRHEQFRTPAPVAVGAPKDLAKVVEAVKDAFNTIPVIAYSSGSNAVSVVAERDGLLRLQIIMPSKNFGANPVRLTVTRTELDNSVTVLATSSGVLDTVDGNKEYAMCSNRGMCDFGSGQCKCFSGYFGIACDTQNALKV